MSLGRRISWHAVAKPVGGIPATDVAYAGSTNLSAVNVEAALDELDTEKAAVSHSHPLVGWSLTKSAQQSINPTTETAVTWDGELFDTNGFHDTVTNTSRITIPAGNGGKYLVGASVSVLGLSNGQSFTLYLYKNGAFMSAGTWSRAFSSGTDQGLGLSFSVLTQLAAGDYIQTMVFHNDTVANPVDTSASGAVFWGEYRGA